MKRFRKIVKYLLYIIVSFLLVDLAVVVFFSVYRPPLQKADAIIILGSAINTPSLYNRTMDGLKLYNQGKAAVMVLSGGVDYPRSMPEADYMEKVILQNASSPLPNLILEPNSNSTYQNIVNSKALIPNAKSIIVVSDSFHLARAVLMAEREGFSPVYWSSPDPVYYNKTELAFYYLREVFAMIDYIPKFIFG